MKVPSVLLPVLTTLALACEPSRLDPMVEKCAFIRKEIRDHLADLDGKARNFDSNLDADRLYLDLTHLTWWQGLVEGEFKAREIFCPETPEDKTVYAQISPIFDMISGKVDALRMKSSPSKASSVR